jgi:hypothetical protein
MPRPVTVNSGIENSCAKNLQLENSVFENPLEKKTKKMEKNWQDRNYSAPTLQRCLAVKPEGTRACTYSTARRLPTGFPHSTVFGKSNKKQAALGEV